MVDKGELAKQIFPNEIWNEVSPNLFTANSRIPKNDKEKERLEKEIQQAQILTENKKIVSETKDAVIKTNAKNLSIDFSDRQLFISLDNDRKLHTWQLKNIEKTARKLIDKKSPRATGEMSATRGSVCHAQELGSL